MNDETQERGVPGPSNDPCELSLTCDLDKPYSLTTILVRMTREDPFELVYAPIVKDHLKGNLDQPGENL